MACCGSRGKPEKVTKEQQWDWLNLSDFKSTSCLTPLSYGILYISLLVSVACYVVDVFTAVNLLGRGQWSGIVKPAIPIQISRWIFAGCIILSWVLLVYRWIRAVRAMRTGGVAQSYLDPLAVRIQSIRMGAKGRGWRRFLVFAELTKSKKGSEYVALFTYFSFEAWLRIIFAEGPRNAINAMTLYSVMQANLLPTGAHDTSGGRSPFTQFFYNLMVLAESNKEEAAVLFGMLFTLIIWVISAISLMVAFILYIMFLWHHIPSQDGGLRSYCKRKVDRRLQKVVTAKVNKAIAKEDMAQGTGDKFFGKPGDRPIELKRQPTLPILDTDMDDKGSEFATLSRQTTLTNLSPFDSRPPTSNGALQPGLQRQPTIPNVSMDSHRPTPPTRSNTQFSSSSAASYGSNVPLISSANPMGYGPTSQSYSQGAPSRTGSDRSIANGRPMMSRSGTASSQGSSRQYTPAWEQQIMPPQGAQPGLLGRQNTDFSEYQPPGRMTRGPPSRQNTGFSDYQSSSGRSLTGPPARQNTGIDNCSNPEWSQAGLSPIDSQGRRKPLPLPSTDAHGRRMPVQNNYHPGPQEFEMRSQPQQPPAVTHELPAPRYTAYNTNFTSAPPISQTPSAPRNFSAPLRSARQPESFNAQRPVPPQRSGTAPLPQTAQIDTYDDSIYDSYGVEDENFTRPAPPTRAATAGPSAGPRAGNWQGQGQSQRQPQYRQGSY